MEKVNHMIENLYPKERLISEWKRDLVDSLNVRNESELHVIQRSARSTMDLAIKLYGFEFADELQQIRKEVLK